MENLCCNNEEYSLNKLIDWIRKDRRELIERMIKSFDAVNESQKDPTRTIRLSGLDSVYYLSEERALQALSLEEDGTEKEKEFGGNHPVSSLNGVHVKANRGFMPLNPCMDRAIYLLHTLLLGPGITPTILVTFKGLKHDPRPQCAQVSKSVNGILLEKFLAGTQNSQDLFHTLDDKSLTIQIFSSILTTPADAKEDNFMVNENGEIINIDADDALFSPIIYYQGTEQASHSVGVKNTLYTISYVMERTVNPEVRDRLLSLSPEGLILSWLSLLRNMNKADRELFEKGYLKREDYESNFEDQSTFPLKLSEKMGLFVLSRIKKLQSILLDHPHLTHNELLERMDPLVAQFYSRLRKLYVIPKDALFHIYKPHSLEDQLTLRKRLIDGRWVLKELRLHTLTERNVTNRTQDLSQALQSILEICDLALLSQSHALQMLFCLHCFCTPDLLRSLHSSWKEKSALKRFPLKKIPDRIFPLIDTLGHDLTNSLEQSSLEIALAQDATSLVIHSIRRGINNISWRAVIPFWRSHRQNTDVMKALHQLGQLNSVIGWRIAVETLLPENQQGIIKTASLRNRDLPVDFEYQLFHPNGSINPINNYGKRNVGRISSEGYSLYVKEFPELPGLEQGVAVFLNSLLGYGAPQGNLIRIRNRPYYLSQGIDGDTLQDVLMKDPIRLKKLDPVSTSGHIVASILINPEDGKPDNYILRAHPLKKEFLQLIAIDNDHSFGITAAKVDHKILPQVKCVLYCLDQMNDLVDPSVAQRILSLDPFTFLQDWLMELSGFNTEYMDLFTQQESKDMMENKSTFIGVAFTPKMLSRLYEKFLRLQRALKKSKGNLTHFSLLREIEPLLFSRYEAVYDEFKTSKNPVWERFKKADGGAYLSRKNGTFLSTTTLAKFLTTMNIPIKEEILSAIRRGGYVGPNAALEELQAIQQQLSDKSSEKNLQAFRNIKTDLQRHRFLKSLSFKDMILVEQREWIDALRTFGRHRKLILRDSSELSLQDFTGSGLINFKPGFFLSNVTLIDLSGCIQVTEAVIEKIAQETQALKTLFLERLPNLKYLGKKNNPLKFAYLETLSLAKCKNLRSLCLHSLFIRNLNTKGCDKVTTFDIPHLNKKLITAPIDCSNITIDKFEFSTVPIVVNELKNYSSLTSLSFTGNQINDTVAVLLAGMNNLTQLDLTDNEIGVAGAEALAQNSTLICLNLSRNGIGEGVQKFVNNGTLKTLILQRCELTSTAIELAQNKSLTELDLNYNSLGGEIWKPFSQNTTLTWLNCALVVDSVNNEIPLSQSLKWLNLYTTRGICSHSATYLAQNTHLTALNIAETVYSHGAERFFTKNKNLLALDWSRGWDSDGSDVATIATNNTLTWLNLSGKRIDDSTIIALALNNSIKWLILLDNDFTDEGARALAKNKTLTWLDLRGNYIGRSGAIALAQNTNLKWLFLTIPHIHLRQRDHNLFVKHTFVSLYTKKIPPPAGKYNCELTEKNDDSLWNFDGILAETLRSLIPNGLQQPNIQEELPAYDDQVLSDQENIEEISKIESSFETSFYDYLDEDSDNPITNSSDEDYSFDLPITIDPSRENSFYRTALSLEGGGARAYGIILTMEEVENYSHSSVHSLFDTIIGSSVGGILGLGYTATEDGSRPYLSSAQLNRLFTKNVMGKSTNVLSKIFNLLTRNRENQRRDFTNLMKQLFGELSLSDTLIPTIIPVIKGNNTPLVLNSEIAQKNMVNDYKIWSIASGASFIPGALDPLTITSLTEKSIRIKDSGAWNYNPSELALKETVKLFGSDQQISIISIGTGAAPPGESIYTVQVKSAHENMLSSLSMGESYHRLEPRLPTIAMNDFSKSAFDEIRNAVSTQTYKNKIEHLARFLLENRDRKHPLDLSH